jgi:hypothetical protein
VQHDPADVSPGFRELVDRQAALWFEQILPRYIHAYYRGRGHALVSALLLDLDAHRIAEAVALPAPSARALGRAAGVQRTCPVVVAPGAGPRVIVTGDDGFPVEIELPGALGGFRHSYQTLHYTPTSSTVVDDQRSVTLYQGAFRAVDRDKLDDEILTTIAHEYVHFFESYLPPRDQVLALRETLPELAALEPLDLETAHRRDTWYTFWWWARGPAVIAAMVLAFAALLALIT